MANHLDYLKLLQAKIQERYKCAAAHRESAFVREMLEGQIIWTGYVEIFDLIGHADAEKCFAWTNTEKRVSGSVLNSENMQLITVLGKRPVDSPQMAVRAAIFYNVQSAPVRDIDNYDN